MEASVASARTRVHCGERERGEGGGKKEEKEEKEEKAVEYRSSVERSPCQVRLSMEARASKVIVSPEAYTRFP